MNAYIPGEWLNNTNEELNFFVISELGAIEPIARAVMLDQLSGRIWPLVRDDSQPHLISDGPWLIQLNLDASEHSALGNLINASHAWIAARSEGESLSRQLAPALRCTSPAKDVHLLRFYCPEIIEILKVLNEQPWFNELFANLTSWHLRTESGNFRPVFESPLVGELAKPNGWILEVSEKLWCELAGNPEVDALISCFTKDTPEVLCSLNSKEKQKRVKDGLTKADALGIKSPEDRRVYVYLELAAGGDVTKSAKIKEIAERSVRVQKPLVHVLDRLAEQESL